MWPIAALSGFGLLAMGFTALCLGTIFSGMFDDLTLYFWMIGLGLLGLLIGATGLAIKLDGRKRRKLCALLFFGPLAVCVVAGMVDPNVHGVGPLFFLASIPAWLLAIVLVLTSLKS
jgi:hypothetical protein